MEPTLWWGHGFGFMWLFPILFFVLFMFFMRGSRGCGFRGDSTKHEDSAREILDKRLAKGEITKEEHEEMKKSLSNETS